MLLAIALVSIAAGLLPAPALGFFGKAKSFATELRAYSMAVGDLNGDGNPDLAVANVGVAVLLGNGNGGFGKPRLIGPGTPSSAVAIGDLNGDGNPDLAVTQPGSPAEFGSGGVSVLLGNGNGGFGKPQLFDAGALFARAIGIGDFNGDGKPDLVFIRGSAFGKPEAVSVLLGNGDGSFGPATEYSAGFEALSLAIGDLNGDGKPDLAIDSPEYTGGGVHVLLGNGDGSFGRENSYGIGGDALSVAIGKLNGDRKPDLAVANFSSNAVSVLLGNGDGSFGPAQNFAAGDGPNWVAIGKLNGDAYPDLALTNQGAGSVSVLLGNGAGSFGRPKDFAVGAEPGSIAIGDLNGDPRPDLVVGKGAQRSVSVLLNGRSSAALSLTYQRRGHRFSGRLRSIDPVCANHRWVVVRRRRKGPDRKVGGAKTSRRGTYSVRRNARRGTYYARVSSWSACRAENSKVITFR
jgi:hypothetical protein